ncbi:MAG: hypothetical protein JWN45_3292 [Acidobacteriaceae bacterium]|nr:hypothetical protein [Acidobacteriaceae bacterium]
MIDTVCIDSPEALSRFVFQVDRLHDALLHEAVLLHPGYVDQDRKMWGDAELPNTRLLFQSQSPDFSAVQVNLSGITRFRLDPQLEFQLEAEFDEDELVFYPSGKSNADRSEIRAAHGEYKILGQQFLGSEYKLAHSPE